MNPQSRPGRMPATAEPCRVTACPHELDDAATLFAASHPLPLVAVASARTAAADRCVLGQGRSAAESTEAVVIESRLGPVGRSAQVQYGEVLATHLDLAGVAAALALMPNFIRTFTVLGSTAKLTEPTPSLIQHIQSWLPHSAFIADLEAGVVVSAKHGLTEQLPTGCITFTAHADESHPLRPHAAELVNRLQPRSCTPVLVDPSEVKTFWGDSSALEICTVAVTPDELAEHTLAKAHPCEWCGDRIAERMCPRCCAVQTSSSPLRLSESEFL